MGPQKNFQTWVIAESQGGHVSVYVFVCLHGCEYPPCEATTYKHT